VSVWKIAVILGDELVEIAKDAELIPVSCEMGSWVKQALLTLKKALMSAHMKIAVKMAHRVAPTRHTAEDTRAR
jgi:hypothetical protein